MVGILSYIDWEQLFSISVNANFSLLVIAVHLAIPNLFFSWLKWDYVVRFLDHTVRRRDTFSSVLSGLALDTVTISHIGDYAGRMINMTRYPKMAMIALQFFEKIHLSVISVWFGSLSLILISFRLSIGSLEANLMLGTGIFLQVLSIFAFLVSFRPVWIARFLFRFRFIPKPMRIQVIETARRFRLEDSAYLFIVNHLKYFTFITQFYLILLAFHPVPVLDGFLGATATMLVRTLLSGLTIGDLGVREISAIYFFGTFGISMEAAFFAALLLFIINRLAPSTFGMLIILLTEFNLEPLTKQWKFLRTRKTRHPRRKKEPASFKATPPASL